MAGHADRVALIRRNLEQRANPILRAFRYSWDGTAEGVRRFRDGLDGWDEPTSIRDEAEDYLDDLIGTLRR